MKIARNDVTAGMRIGKQEALHGAEMMSKKEFIKTTGLSAAAYPSYVVSYEDTAAELETDEEDWHD